MSNPSITDSDVLIVGAGLSGIGAACQLRTACPNKSVTVLEARSAIGGTWDLFRYPGIRSDSDMFTLGYRFRPWTDPKAIADGPTILRYIHDTAEEFDVQRLIRLNHRVVSAHWDSAQSRWTVHVERTDTHEQLLFCCAFLYVCSGYYRYDEGFSPRFPGVEQFGGPVIHPQHWPADLDHAGKRVVVIGSGATAVTLVPSLAETAGHVTMLQRSPSYVAARPAHDPIADRLRAQLPQKLAYALVRWKNALLGITFFNLSRRRPELIKSMLRKAATKQLPPGYAVDTHFAPSYNPWDQRMCLVPDGDLFAAIRDGRADIVTDQIDTFTPTGLRLQSGAHLDADIVVSATGLNMLAIGGMALRVDGRDIDVSQTVSYKGMMLSGVPNFAWTVGYTNASWTLKADLVAEYVCRLLQHMDRHHYASVTPDATGITAANPFLDLRSGYVQRSLAGLPTQGEHAPWRLHQNYVKDVWLLRRGRLDDDVIFTAAPAAAPARHTTAMSSG
ncbi:FAD dependent oxidoreductase [Mycobacterium parascrofulaceum ATCC BAA-614]|uniref:FAD dependent oxidoreductase n=1 Tax=Mycobacterium parascrofulaceum ATCC BAA-614 TaxID=525368 RepID=D5P633_9MYCO|nr:NAD(P)/FAD-dependent oxidoreductase [Mycobacterium parascrofulaceum]EFG78469.1 FAD dependent oxidoreductase [Mycobacterium parascrofulaceum ATCC BAA-614]